MRLSSESTGTAWRTVVAGTAAALLLAGTAVETRAQDGTVTHTVNGNTETWRIDEPNVKKKIIEFPQIRFQPGDQVRVTAGGCVQTGGWGKSWKRYVDPLGRKSDRLYHGMVLIPGAIGTLPATSLSRFARILIIKGHTFTVGPLTEPRSAFLRLGYEDDEYGDNGYYDQDAGSQGQCRIGNGWVEHAFVVVNVVHGAPPPAGALAPFDISTNTITAGNPPVDDNGILLNPMWGRQITHNQLPDVSHCNGGRPYSSPCTTQPTQEDTALICSAFVGEGHHNWVPGTYEGTVYWNNLSNYFADRDYNFRLVRPDNAGLTTQNKNQPTAMRKSMKLEFASFETINHFKTPWWDAFHDAVDDGFSAANAMITGPDGSAGTFGIVTGLVGLDCAHTCASEVHPVWAMALRVKHDPADETWAIFVRRAGNEGFCSSKLHVLTDLPDDTYTFRLPWRPGASAVGVGSATVFHSRLGQATGSMAVAQNQGVLISFRMAAPTSGVGERVNGELHLRWTIPEGGERPPVVGSEPPVREAEGSSDTPGDEAEDRMNRLLAAMTPAQRKTLDALIPQNERLAYDEAPLRFRGEPTRMTSLPLRVVGPRPPSVRTIPDDVKEAWDRRLLHTLHEIYGREIPGFPDEAPTPKE